MPRECHIRSQHWKGERIRVDLRGSLASGAIDALEAEFGRRLAAGHTEFVIHMAHLEDLSVVGVVSLLICLRRIEERGGAVSLVEPTAPVRRILDELGVLNGLHVVENASELIGVSSRRAPRA